MTSEMKNTISPPRPATFTTSIMSDKMSYQYWPSYNLKNEIMKILIHFHNMTIEIRTDDDYFFAI